MVQPLHKIYVIKTFSNGHKKHEQCGVCCMEIYTIGSCLDAWLLVHRSAFPHRFMVLVNVGIDSRSGKVSDLQSGGPGFESQFLHKSLFRTTWVHLAAHSLWYLMLTSPEQQMASLRHNVIFNCFTFVYNLIRCVQYK